MSSTSNPSSRTLPILAVAGASLAAVALAWAVGKMVWNRRRPGQGGAPGGVDFLDWEDEEGPVRAEFI